LAKHEIDTVSAAGRVNLMQLERMAHHSDLDLALVLCMFPRTAEASTASRSEQVRIDRADIAEAFRRESRRLREQTSHEIMGAPDLADMLADDWDDDDE